MSATRLWLLFPIAAVLLSPFFFIAHRLVAFHTVPYDDYAPYLLWLAGTGQGFVPASPYAYRVLSMVLAWPFFLVQPSLALTNLPADLSPMWLRATLALNAMNFLALIGAVALTIRIADRRCGLAASQAVLAGALLFALAWFTQMTAIDGLALLLIAGAIALLERPGWFCALLLLSIPANEKVALVVALWLGARVLLIREDRRRLALPCGIAIAAMMLYIAMVLVLHIPGNAYQTDPGGFLVTVRENVLAYATARGVTLNVLPITVLTCLGLWGHVAPPAGMAPLFRRVDLLVIAGLAGVALLFTHSFQAGRIVLHAAPLFVIPVARRV